MHNKAFIFIQDLAVIMLVAGFITILCHRLKQPVVLGYILAGVILGPHTPPFSFIHDENTVNILAELGVIFLMFSLGLEFNLRKLSHVGIAATVTALIEIIFMTYAGYSFARLLNWSQTDAIFLGAMLAISSTTIIIKALDDLGIKRKGFAQLIFGVLIIEDIFAIAILALLSSIAITGSWLPEDMIITISKLCSFLVISLIVGILVIPRLLSYISKFNSQEMLLVSVLGICFGFCLLVIKLGYSVALGAFISGAIVAESRQLGVIEFLITPLRDMFSAIFFVSVGLLFNPSVFAEYTFPIIGIAIVVIVGKIISCTLGALLAGRDGKTAMHVGMGMAQIGEFSFIIAALRSIVSSFKTNLLFLLSRSPFLDENHCHTLSLKAEHSIPMLWKGATYVELKDVLNLYAESRTPLKVNHLNNTMEGKEAVVELSEWLEVQISQGRFSYSQAYELLCLISSANGINPMIFKAKLKEAKAKNVSKRITTQFDMTIATAQIKTEQAIPSPSDKETKEEDEKRPDKKNTRN